MSGLLIGNELPPRPVCKHCGRDKVNRPRGLCWVCYYTPGVRQLYPSTSMYARRGVWAALGNFMGSQLPEETTSARPGSAEKIAVMEQRIASRVELFHPHDSRTLHFVERYKKFLKVVSGIAAPTP